MKILWRPAARDDRRQITAWLAERNPAAAIRMSRALLAAVDGLAVFPERGSIGDVPGMRELFAVPPYVIVYQVDQSTSTVRIVRIWHSAQNRSE